MGAPADGHVGQTSLLMRLGRTESDFSIVTILRKPQGVDGRQGTRRKGSGRRACAD